MKHRRDVGILILASLVVAAGIVKAGVFYYDNQMAECKAAGQSKLVTIADLKVDELALWKRERLADANNLYRNPVFSSLVRRCFERPDDPALQEELRTWVNNLRTDYRYDRIALHNAATDTWTLFSDDKTPLTPLTVQNAHRVERSGQLTFTDFYRNEYSQKIYLRLFVPILDEQAGGRAIGALMLRIDPDDYFYPLIQRWPVPSKTSELLLVRREGDEVVFLNELRFQKNTALSLRFPLKRADVPAVMAALGKTGSYEGIDYRGVPVLAAIRAIPDSPWRLIAKIDAEEVFAPMRERFWTTLALACAALTAFILAIGLLWQRQRAHYYREQARTEALLREAEGRLDLAHKYRAILDQTFGFIGLMTPDGALVEANRAALEFVGTEQLNVLGKPFWETPWWTHSKEMQDRLREAIKTAASGEFVRFEATHRAANGEIHFVDFSLKPVWNETGEIVFLIPEGRDVTDQKRAEEGMREFETRFRDIIDNSREGILFADLDGRTIFSANQAMAAMLGWSREELAGMPLMSIHPDYARDQVAQEFDRHRAGVVSLSSNVPVTCKDGSRIYADITSAEVTLNGVKYLAGFFRDVTDRKKAEDALRESERRLKEAEAMAHLGYWSWDVRTGDVKWSDEVFNIFNLDPKSFTPKIDSILELSPWPEDRNRDRELIQKATETHEKGEYVQRFLRPDKSVGYYQSTFQGNYDDGGNLVSIVGTVLDITERKCAEMKLTEINRHLEDATARATELASKAEAASLAKSRFLTNMSHELRTPLNAVIGFSEGLLERIDVYPLNAHQQDRLRRIKTSGEYLLQLINSILDVAKAESGRIDLRIAPFVVEPIVWEVGGMVEALIEDKHDLQFTLDMPDTLPQMISDRDKVRQILVNLLSNAVKFTYRGSVVLRVCPDNDSLVFRVEDTGVGVSPENLDQLFEPFFQVRQEVHQSLSGTGLGLSISKSLATLLHGTLTVESTLGQGSVFTLTLPLVCKRSMEKESLKKKERDPIESTKEPVEC